MCTFELRRMFTREKGICRKCLLRTVNCLVRKADCLGENFLRPRKPRKTTGGTWRGGYGSDGSHWHGSWPQLSRMARFERVRALPRKYCIESCHLARIRRRVANTCWFVRVFINNQVDLDNNNKNHFSLFPFRTPSSLAMVRRAPPSQRPRLQPHRRHSRLPHPLHHHRRPQPSYQRRNQNLSPHPLHQQ